MTIRQQVWLVIVFITSQSFGQDLTGTWVGSLDQSAAADTIEGYRAYWEEGIWEEGNYTHDLVLTLFQDTSDVKGLYDIATHLNPDHNARFTISGSLEDGILKYQTVYLIEQNTYQSGYSFCYNTAELKYHQKDGEEFLEGQWQGWDDYDENCAGAYIFLKKQGNRHSKISEIDLSGEWRGYEDQTNAAKPMEGYASFWEDGLWVEGEKTGIVKVNLNQEGAKTQGEYWDYFPSDSSFYADYKIIGWIEDSTYTFMSFEILEESAPEGIVFCEFWASLKFSSKDGYDALYGTAQEDYEGEPCAPAVIFLTRKTPEKKVGEAVEVIEEKQVPEAPVIDTLNSVAGTKITLDKVQFDQSSYKIREDARSQLDFLVGWMKEHQNMIIQLEGHTDNRGPANLNMKLSLNRVKSIKAYLVDKGIHKKRIQVKAYGSTKPIASNKDPETRKLNRRVELVILDK